MKIKLSLLFAFLILTGCSVDDDLENPEKNFVGNNYAHLLFDTREECEASWDDYFMNCAQTLEVINEEQVVIMVTDILYRTNYSIENDKFIVRSSPDTYEFSQDLIFHIMDDGSLTLGNTRWMRYEESFFELYDSPGDQL